MSGAPFAAAWQVYVARALATSPPEAVAEFKRHFYAGAHAALGAIIKAAEASADNDAATDAVAEIHLEIHAIVATMARGTGAPEICPDCGEVLFTPSQVDLNGLLVATMGHAEEEAAALLIVRGCQALGDRWQPLRFSQISEVSVDDHEAGRSPLANLLANPYFRPNIHGLVERGFARWIDTRACISCGCTYDRACPGGCAWLDESVDVCTACAAVAEERGTSEALLSRALEARREPQPAPPVELTAAGLAKLQRWVVRPVAPPAVPAP